MEGDRVMSEPGKSWNDFEGEEQGFVKEYENPLQGLRETHSHCPPPDMIIAAEGEALPEELARRVKDHLENCRLCQVLGRDLKRMGASGTSADERARIEERVFAHVPLPGAKRLWWLWGWQSKAVAVLAAAVLAVSALTWMYLRQSAQESPTEQAAQAPPVTPATSSVFRLEKPPVKILATSVLAWRGTGGTPKAQYLQELESALEPYEADDFAAASARLAEVAAQYPSGAEAAFYLGICRLFLGQNRDAIAALRASEAIGEDALAQELSWYLSLALQRAGDIAGASARLKELCEVQSPYKEPACKGLKELASASEAPTRR
jgi:TolA-binding protein